MMRDAFSGSFHRSGSSAATLRSFSFFVAASTSKRPPQQPDRLLDLVDDRLDLCAHECT
jgi:hypothetical protein